MTDRREVAHEDEHLLTINRLYKQLETMYDETTKLRARTQCTRVEQQAMILMEGHVKCAEEIAYILGNMQDPSG